MSTENSVAPSNPHGHAIRALNESAPLLLDLPEWMDEGICNQTDPDEFFPDKGGSSAMAKRICRGCPVMAQCLDYAVDRNERFGIWGGQSEHERRKIRNAA